MRTFKRMSILDIRHITIYVIVLCAWCIQFWLREYYVFYRVGIHKKGPIKGPNFQGKHIACAFKWFGSADCV